MKEITPANQQVSSQDEEAVAEPEDVRDVSDLYVGAERNPDFEEQAEKNQRESELVAKDGLDNDQSE